MRTSKKGIRGALLHLACAAIGVVALAGTANAQSPEEIKVARQTAGEALTAYNAGEFEKALGLFSQAKALYPSAQILRMLGYSELALEHWKKAAEALEGAMEAKISPLSKEDRKDVQDQLAKALAHLGTITIVTKTPHSTISIDGDEAKPLPLDKPVRIIEGKHKLVVKAPDHLDTTLEIKVEGGKSAEIPIEPKEKPKPPPPKAVVVAPPPPPPKTEYFKYQKPIGFAAAGAGVALGGAALATTITWLRLKGSVETEVADWSKKDHCPASDPRACEFNKKAINLDADRADKLRNVSLGMGVAAGVLAIGGAVLIVLPIRKKQPPPQQDAAPPTARGPEMSCGVAGAGGVVCSGAF